MDKDQLAKTIGENIIHYRKAAQMTQGKLAQQLQISTAFLCRLERGEKIPSVLTLLLTAQALHVSTDALLYRGGQSPHASNILAMLQGQSETSVKRIEQIIRVLLQEYP